MEVWQEVGVPPGVVNFLSGVGEEIGPTLVNHPDVAMIAFTGSKGVGLLLNREAAFGRFSFRPIVILMTFEAAAFSGFLRWPLRMMALLARLNPGQENVGRFTAVGRARVATGA